MDTLRHLAKGEIALFPDESKDDMAWGRLTHRGVQFLDKVEYPRKEKRYIFSPRFEVRYDTAFDQTLAACAAPREIGRPWLCPPLQEAYRRLHRMGYAHSYETWQDGQLVGGAIGIQIGAFLTCESMFHTVSNASKAAWGQTLARLQQRGGFQWVDVAEVAEHHVNYGEEWIPQWRFDLLQREAMRKYATLADNLPCPKLPLTIRAELEAIRLLRGLRRRLSRVTTAASPTLPARV